MRRSEMVSKIAESLVEHRYYNDPINYLQPVLDGSEK